MKSAFLLSKGLLCLYDKQNNIWLLVDMEFLFSCSTRHLTRSLCSLVSYRVKHSKRNSISKRAHVLFSIFLLIPLTDAVPQLQNYPLWTSRGLVAFSCCTFLIKTLLSVIFEKRVKPANAITYFLTQTPYYASLNRCSVRQVFERITEMAWELLVEGTMNLGSQNLILCNMSCCYNSSPS